MRILLDTNRYSDFQKQIAEVVIFLEHASAVSVPFSTIAELRAGFARGTRQAANEGRLQQFLGQPRVAVLYPDDRKTQVYAELFAYLRQRGTPIPVNDLWIAALAVQHGLAIYARDRHFDRLPQISVI